MEEDVGRGLRRDGRERPRAMAKEDRMEAGAGGSVWRRGEVGPRWWPDKAGKEMSR